MLAALLTILCSQLAVVARANDGDWTEDNVSHWWWKIVAVGDMLHAANPAVQIEEIRSAKPGCRAYAVSSSDRAARASGGASPSRRAGSRARAGPRPRDARRHRARSNHGVAADLDESKLTMIYGGEGWLQ